MLISEAFPSDYLRAVDLKGRQIKAVISHLEMRDIGDDHKPVVFFQGKDKGLVLNKTNSNNIALAYGDDTDDWTGKEVVMYEAMVDFQGRSVAAIRIRPPKPHERGPQRTTISNGAAQTAPTTPHDERNPPPVAGSRDDALSDDIPF